MQHKSSGALSQAATSRCFTTNDTVCPADIEAQILGVFREAGQTIREYTKEGKGEPISGHAIFASSQIACHVLAHESRALSTRRSLPTIIVALSDPSNPANYLWLIIAVHPTNGPFATLYGEGTNPELSFFRGKIVNAWTEDERDTIARDPRESISLESAMESVFAIAEGIAFLQGAATELGSYVTNIQ